MMGRLMAHVKRYKWVIFVFRFFLTVASREKNRALCKYRLATGHSLPATASTEPGLDQAAHLAHVGAALHLWFEFAHDLAHVLDGAGTGA